MNQHSNKFLKISTLCIAGTIMLSFNAIQANAEITYVSDQPLAGVTKTIEDSVAALNAQNTEATLSDEYDYSNIGIANVKNHLNIRKEPGEDKAIVGKLPKDAGCKILEIDKNGWAKIQSGKVTGYAMSTYLITGEEAVSLAKEIGSLVATVDTDALNVRADQSLLSEIITSVPREEELEVLEVTDEWLKVNIDNDDGYIARRYVKLSYELKKAVSVEELVTGEKGIRADLVAYAKRFLGNRYVYGGNSLENGIDCSGFTQQIYKKFGITIDRHSGSQADDGVTVSPKNVRPGDLVFYGNGSRINHVAIYIGNGQVIHASNPRSGIKISNMFYRSPITAERIIND